MGFRQAPGVHQLQLIEGQFYDMTIMMKKIILLIDNYGDDDQNLFLQPASSDDWQSRVDAAESRSTSKSPSIVIIVLSSASS